MYAKSRPPLTQNKKRKNVRATPQVKLVTYVRRQGAWPVYDNTPSLRPHDREIDSSMRVAVCGCRKRVALQLKEAPSSGNKDTCMTRV